AAPANECRESGGGHSHNLQRIESTHRRAHARRVEDIGRAGHDDPPSAAGKASAEQRAKVAWRTYGVDCQPKVMRLEALEPVPALANDRNDAAPPSIGEATDGREVDLDDAVLRNAGTAQSSKDHPPDRAAQKLGADDEPLDGRPGVCCGDEK